MTINNIYVILAVIIVVVILVLFKSKFSQRQGFSIEPEKIFRARPILEQPNSFQRFRKSVCPPSNSACVDAIDYFDAKHLINEGKFTSEHIY